LTEKEKLALTQKQGLKITAVSKKQKQH